MIENPCYKCERRKATCHSTCEDYKAYSEERKKIRHERRVTGDLTSVIYNNKCAERRGMR